VICAGPGRVGCSRTSAPLSWSAMPSTVPPHRRMRPVRASVTSRVTCRSTAERVPELYGFPRAAGRGGAKAASSITAAGDPDRLDRTVTRAGDASERVAGGCADGRALASGKACMYTMSPTVTSSSATVRHRWEGDRRRRFSVTGSSSSPSSGILATWPPRADRHDISLFEPEPVHLSTRLTRGRGSPGTQGPGRDVGPVDGATDRRPASPVRQCTTADHPVSR